MQTPFVLLGHQLIEIKHMTKQQVETFAGNDRIVREYDPETARLIGHDEDAII